MVCLMEILSAFPGGEEKSYRVQLGHREKWWQPCKTSYKRETHKSWEEISKQRAHKSTFIVLLQT